jgi:ribosomal protein S18 acetylase RimI-like enzyme
MDESRQRRHPEHERLIGEVQSWFRTTILDLGYVVERRRFGFYRRNTENPELRLVVIEAMKPEDAPEFVADAREYFGERDVEIWVEGRELDATLGQALVAAGCVKDLPNVSLAFVGTPPEAVPVAGVTVEAVTPKTLKDYAVTKLKGFANSEAEPTAEQLDRELAIRKSEIEGMGRLLIARVGNEPAAILGYYDGADRSIFNLATRIPFRNRGIAKYLLCLVLADSFDRGCQSVIIGTNPDDTPILLYRRLGFIDEIYWRRGYMFEPAKSPAKMNTAEN